MAYKFHLKSQEMAYDADGYRYWKTIEKTVEHTPSELAIVIVDVWDKHWCRGALARSAPIAEKINEVVSRARENGVFIVNAPSDTMDYYKDSPARKRALDIDAPEPLEVVKVENIPLPVDSSDGGSDTKDDGHPADTPVWGRQTEIIRIDEERDIISDEGRIIYAHLKKRGIKRVVFMGVHTNMCVLNRSFAIKAMVRWGLSPVLARDLTDAMYNPGRAPYVSHEEGTRLVVEYIEKFYCPTIDSSQLM